MRIRSEWELFELWGAGVLTGELRHPLVVVCKELDDTPGRSITEVTLFTDHQAVVPWLADQGQVGGVPVSFVC